MQAATTALALLVAACGSDPADRAVAEQRGPLAIIESTGVTSLDAIGGTGPINIGERCVTVPLNSSPSKELLLIWRSAEVVWEDGQITFTSRSVNDPKPVTIRNGDEVTVGGEYFETEGEAERIVDWVAEPHESCNGDQYIVNSVTKQGS